MPRQLMNRRFLSPADDTHAVPLAESLVSFSRRSLARHGARCVTCLFLLTMSYPPRRSLNRSFLSLADALPGAPLVVSFVCFSRRRIDRGAAY
jgi:hypothetical protein